MRSALRFATSCFALVTAAGTAAAQSNDCTNAPTVSAGTHTGSTLGATNDGGGCGFSEDSPDVWYKLTPAEDQFFSASLCDAAGFDTILALHSGCPGDQTTLLTCNDDFCGFQSRIDFRLTATQTYYIRVSGFAGDAGAFMLTISLEAAPPAPTEGPDVIVGTLLDMNNYGIEGGVAALSVGTESCNVGSQPLNWIASTNEHPVIASNMYRLKDGRFEQIGQSWLKHGFLAVNDIACGPCEDPGTFSQLGVNCSDPYGAGLNGFQPGLGPRSVVNATTGSFPYPYTAPPFTGTAARRLQVDTVDLDPSLNDDAVYFIEGIYVAADDAMAGNGLNNASHREIEVTSITGVPQFVDDTVQQEPAILAWAARDEDVVLIPVDVLEGEITTRFWVGASATLNPDDTWSYEYAVFNLNSSRAAGGFAVPVPSGALVTDIGFHDTSSHSGEPFSTDDWIPEVGESISWSTAPFAENANANALRWGTLYNFRFTTTAAPADENEGDPVTLTLFAPGDPVAVEITGAIVPGLIRCRADWNRDGQLDSSDLFAFISVFFDGNADYDLSGGTDSSDFFLFIQDFFAGC